MTHNIYLELLHGDLLEIQSDVVVLKHQSGFDGADWRIVKRLIKSETINEETLTPITEDHRIIWKQSVIAIPHILVIKNESSSRNLYSNLRMYGYKVIKTVKDKMPNDMSISLALPTVDGIADDLQIYQDFFTGILNSIKQKECSPALNKIAIVSEFSEKITRCRKFFDEKFVDGKSIIKNSSGYILNVEELQSHFAYDKETGLQADESLYAFIAMPFSKEFEDVYYYGIQNAGKANHLICERNDEDAFFGDVLDRIRRKIEGSNLVIAVLDSASPNVYLELGYAWGKGKPTILIAKNTKELHFNVRSQKCIIYESIRDLEKKLKDELASLQNQGLL